jgi:hypothetical protein
MIDPVTAAAIGTGLHSLVKLSNAYAEVRILRARAELASAAAHLPPGAEIRGSDRNGNCWVVRVSDASLLSGADDEQ